MKNTLFAIIIVLFTINANANPPKTPKVKKGFSFAFLTDIHLNKGDNNCFKGLEKAINSAKEKEVDFILTGGDNVDIDVLGEDAETAHELYKNYADIIANSGIEYYATIGNHDRFFGCKRTEPLYNEGLFEKYISDSYYSFNHKKWHFIVLNTSNSIVDERQKLWLTKDLKKVDDETPIIISCHVPFLSVYYPALEGRYTDADTFKNFKEIWDMFEGKNLKLVLQGHQHLYEEIKTRGVQFITGGAVSASWWGGNYHGTEEGYLLINIEGDDFDWEYVDYGWEVEKE